MDFAVKSRTVESGRFATLSSEGRPVAQVFVPGRPPVIEQFSLFWRAPARRGHVQQLLSRLLCPGSEVKIRLIGRAYVTTFGFSRTRDPNESPDAWNFELVRQLIDKADLPCSLGLTVDKSPMHGWGAEVYVWASITPDTESDLVQGPAEVGVRTTLGDWRNSAFKSAVFPLFESTIGLKDGAGDLWSQAAKAAQDLMPVDLPIA